MESPAAEYAQLGQCQPLSAMLGGKGGTIARGEDWERGIGMVEGMREGKWYTGRNGTGELVCRGDRRGLVIDPRKLWSFSGNFIFV